MELGEPHTSHGNRSLGFNAFHAQSIHSVCSGETVKPQGRFEDMSLLRKLAFCLHDGTIHNNLTASHAPSLRVDSPTCNYKTEEPSSVNTRGPSGSVLSDPTSVSQRSDEGNENMEYQTILAQKYTNTTNDVRVGMHEQQRSLEITKRCNSQLKEALNRAKDNERALEVAINNLESRLEMANNEKLDILEGYYQAREQARKMDERQGFLDGQVRSLCLKLKDSDVQVDGLSRSLYSSEQQVASLQLQLGSTPDRAGFAPLITGLQEQLCQLQEDKDNRGSRIAELELENQVLKDRLDNVVTPMAEMADSSIVAKEQKVTAVSQSHDSHMSSGSPNERSDVGLVIERLQNEKHQLCSLLHAELRRQARLEPRPKDNVASSTKANDQSTVSYADYSVEAASRDLRSPPMSSAISAATPTACASCEDEIRNLVNEIVLYKLDVKGYKKDLRRANALIRTLQTAQAAEPRVSDNSTCSAPSSSAPASMQLKGLGIRLSPQSNIESTAPTSLGRATAEALLIATSPPSCSPHTQGAGLSSVSQSQTPPGTHKKMPRSSQARSTSSRSDLMALRHPIRADTGRSMSESIISIYANSKDTGLAVVK